MITPPTCTFLGSTGSEEAEKSLSFQRLSVALLLS